MTERRFRTKEQIIAEIDRAKELAKQHLREAESYEMEIRAIQIRGYTQEEWLIDEKVKQVERLRKRATSLLEVRCKWLGEKLSEFETLLLPFIEDGDTSIPKFRSVMR
jgi:hypothetical protein